MFLFSIVCSNNGINLSFFFSTVINLPCCHFYWLQQHCAGELEHPFAVAISEASLKGNWWRAFCLPFSYPLISLKVEQSWLRIKKEKLQTCERHLLTTHPHVNSTSIWLRSLKDHRLRFSFSVKLVCSEKSTVYSGEWLY